LSRHLTLIATLALVSVAVGGCATGGAFKKGERAAAVGDWDAAVLNYRTAAQQDPNNPTYQIALDRAMQNASVAHVTLARDFEAKDDLASALREYRKANEFDPSNRQLATKAAEVERKLQRRLEATRPRPPIEDLREKVRRRAGEPLLNPASREPLKIKFTNANIKDILNFIGNAAGINVTYDAAFRGDQMIYSVDLEGVTLEQALAQIMLANGLFYKVVNERTILVANDSQQNRAKYEDMVIRTFYLSNAEAPEIVTLLNTVARPTVQTNLPVPQIASGGKNANTITVRGTASQVAIIERIIEANDKPKAEIVLDVEILEVNKARAKQYGLELSSYSVGINFSPERAPTTSSGGTTGTTAAATTPAGFNLSTISRGINTSDFYFSVPSAVVHFLEADAQTKLIAKPQLRGSEGQKLQLNLGDKIPVPSTTYVPLVAGGTATSPFTSFNYTDVGINLEITPRVTLEGDIIMDLMVQSSTRGQDVNIAGQNLPSFGNRQVTTKLRLRDGESNLLAGLLREDERRSLKGFPGAIHVPVLKQLFSSNDEAINQTDIIFLLTPHVIRPLELTEQDLNPIYVGTTQNPSVGGPPPLLAPPPEAPPAAEPTSAAPGAQPAPGVTPVVGARPTQAGTPVLPPGTSPIPGTVLAPPTKPAGEAPAAAQPPVTQPAAPAPPAAVPPPAQPPTAPAAAPQPAAQPAAPAAAGAQPTAAPARIVVTPPSPSLAVGGGPYTVPISIDGASRVSTLSLTMTFNPVAVRVRLVQEGSFLRQGGATVAFAQQVDPAIGRVDITLTRTSDAAGASGGGLVAAVIFDAVAPGNVTFGISGAATSVGGAPVTLQFTPAAAIVK
jgi:general secretion pathway protein D